MSAQLQPNSSSVFNAGDDVHHCVFRCGEHWFSLAATAVREIIASPPCVVIPDTHRALHGLCHLRSEFIPVINLEQLLELGSSTLEHDDNSKMIVIDGQPLWALRVSETSRLVALETLIAPDGRSDDGQASAVLGTAMLDNRVIRVLDAKNLVDRLRSMLDST